MSVWRGGELVVAQGRKRLYWELSRISPSGVTGVTGAGVTVADPALDELAEAAVLAIDPHPDGLFGVDLTYDRAGVPNPTEINVGRFFTTHQFFTALGVNLPYAYLKLAFGEPPPTFPRRRNPAPEGMVWIRGRLRARARPSRRDRPPPGRPGGAATSTRPLTVFFDFDGTLVDVRERHYRSYRSALARCAGAPWTPRPTGG